MFPCIKCTKPTVVDDERDKEGGEGRRESSTPRTKEAATSLTTQQKGIALRISSGTYKQSKRSTSSTTSSLQKRHPDSVAASVKDVTFPHVEGASSSPTPACEITPSRGSDSASADDIVAVEENESQEWIAEVEEGIKITFVSLPSASGGGNVLKRIRFSQQKFDRYLAQRWWIENYDRIKELYNIQGFDLNTPRRSEDQQGEGSHSRKELALEGSMNSNRDWTQYDPSGNRGKQPSEAFNQAVVSSASMITPESSSSRYEISVCSSSSKLGAEWMVQDEPGVSITIKQSADDGTREIRRLRFSRKQFEVEDAKKWWSENKERVEAQYL